MKRRSTVSSWATRALLVLACLAPPGVLHAQSASAADQKLDSVIREAVQAGRSVRAIVRFATSEDRARGAGVISERGGHLRGTHEDVNALTVDIDASTVSVLAYDVGVAGISVDARVHSTATPKASKSSGAAKARADYHKRGSGMAVAIIDSGVQPHVDLPASRIRAFVDFVNGQTMPYDDFGHGTHVAGIIAGSGGASAALPQPYTGVAPEVDIVALKVLDAHGAGYTSDVVAALDWVGANHRAYNIRVVNLSLGHPVYERAATDPLVRAAEALVRRGIVVVASAGNLGIDPRDGQIGFGGVTSPANGPEVIAVGAVDTLGTDGRSDDRVTNYSSRGPTRFDLFLKPDLVASGQHVVSTSAPGSVLFENYPALHVSGGIETVPAYMMLSGTSMAAPVVAGIAALVLESNPTLSAHAVRAILSFTAQPVPDTSLLAQGAGYVNAYGAVRLASRLTTRAPLGTIWLTPDTTFPAATDQLFGESVAWGKQVVWGRRVLLGNSAYINMFAWKDNVRWGKNLESMVWGSCDGADCDNVVWGNCEGADCDNVVWGNGEGEGCDNVVWGNCDGDECDNVVWGNCEGDDCDNVVWGNCEGDGCDNVVWGNCDSGDCDNVVWGNCDGSDCDNVVWGNCDDSGCDNVVWGNFLWTADGSPRGYWAANTVWGFWESDWLLVSAFDDDNVVWGNAYLDADNVVWGNTVVLTGGIE
jgi:serine protease AprX